MSGEHSHANHPNLEAHLQACSDAAHQFGDDYVHKHMVDCLEDDPNATIYHESSSVHAFKIWMTIAMFVVCLCGLVPKIWNRCAANESALGFINCFAAGIFLAMAIIHILPEGVHLYDYWARKEGIKQPFPLPYAAFLGGYLLVLLVDRVFAKACGHSHGPDGHTHEHDDAQTGKEAVNNSNESNNKQVLPEDVEVKKNDDDTPG